MKITFVSIGLNLSGGDRVIAIYADRLRQRGHDVHLVAPADWKPGLRQQLKSVVRGRGFIRTAKVTPNHLPASVPRTRLSTFRPVTEHDVPDADVVIATWWETAEWVNKLSPAKGAKAYFIQHFEAFEYSPKERVEATWRLPFHKITISSWLIGLSHKYGDKNPSLVLNSVEAQQFHAPPRAKNAMPTIGFLYGDVYWKGTDVCLDAIKRLPFPVKVISFGASVKDPSTTQMPLPAGSIYYYLPLQNFIRDIYAQCDVWMCGSRSEGFGLPILEAMACRCPVVTTEVGAAFDVVREGENGFVVPVEDSAGLAKRLEQVLSLPEPEWKKMSDAAYDTATRYTWDDATVLFEKALELAIERRKRGETK